MNGYIQSGWVEREWQTKYKEEVDSSETKVLPLLAEKCELPPFLTDKRYADFCEDYQHGLKELLDVFNIDYEEKNTQESKGVRKKAQESKGVGKQRGRVLPFASLDRRNPH